MPRGIYPRKPKESDMAKVRANPVIEHVNGVKVEEPEPVAPFVSMKRMADEAYKRWKRLDKLLSLTREAKAHLSEKEFVNVERAVFKEFRAAVLDLSTGVASAATVEPKKDEDDE